MFFPLLILSALCIKWQLYHSFPTVYIPVNSFIWWLVPGQQELGYLFFAPLQTLDLSHRYIHVFIKNGLTYH